MNTLFARRPLKFEPWSRPVLATSRDVTSRMTPTTHEVRHRIRGGFASSMPRLHVCSASRPPLQGSFFFTRVFRASFSRESNRVESSFPRWRRETSQVLDVTSRLISV